MGGRLGRPDLICLRRVERCSWCTLANSNALHPAQVRTQDIPLV